MATLYRRGDKLWCRLKVDGRWIGKGTPYAIGEEAAAQEFAKELEALLNDERGEPERAHARTVRDYAREWVAARRERGIRSAGDDEGRLQTYVLPTIGDLALAAVRPLHFRNIVRSLRASGDLAPRTIIHVFSVSHSMFEDARADELVLSNPVVVKRGELPKKVDKDPRWREGAIFTREEVALLLTSPKLLPDRRVLYALKGLAALRHEEAAELRWRDVDSAMKPLGRILLGETKTDVPRRVPIHPTLAKILDSWRSSGWREVGGRAPTTDDLVVPTRALTVRAASESQKQLGADLVVLGLRHRRGHDLRRTFITLARVDGADRDKLKAITHGASREILDVYTSWPWETFCAEVAKLDFPLSRSARVARLATRLATSSAAARKRWSGAGAATTPTGFEMPPEPTASVEMQSARVKPKPAMQAGEGFSPRSCSRLATALGRAILAGQGARGEALWVEIGLRMRWKAAERKAG